MSTHKRTISEIQEDIDESLELCKAKGYEKDELDAAARREAGRRWGVFAVVGSPTLAAALFFMVAVLLGDKIRLWPDPSQSTPSRRGLTF